MCKPKRSCRIIPNAYTFVSMLQTALPPVIRTAGEAGVRLHIGNKPAEKRFTRAAFSLPPAGRRRADGVLSGFLRHKSAPKQVRCRYTSVIPPIYLPCSATYRERTGSEVGTSVQWQRSDSAAKRKGAGCGYGNRPHHLPNEPYFLNEAVYIRPLKGESGRLRYKSPLPVHQLYSFPFA